MDSITQKGAVAIREKIVPFIKSEKFRLCPVDSLFLEKKTAILTLSSSTAASWQLCIFRRRISLLGMLFYAVLYAVFYAAIFAK